MGNTPGEFSVAEMVIVVTGTSRGLGRELAFLLAAAGANVVATVRSDADAASLLQEAGERAGDVTPILLDVTATFEIERVLQSVVRRFGRLDCVVNSAGVGTAHRAIDVSEADWDAMMDVNLRGLFFVSQAAARIMMGGAQGGSIVNISSQGGLVGLPNGSVYCASKGGVNMLTKALALEWAKDRIRVNAIAPTFIYTPGTAPILDDAGRRAEILAQIPIGRFGEVSDVCNAVIYLCSAAGRLVTGTVLVVDGGWTAR